MDNSHTARTTAADAVLVELGPWVDAFAERVEQAATDPGRAAHQTRVQTRRIRSALKTFVDVFEPAAAASLEDRLGRLAAEFSPLRDTQVIKARLVTLVGSERGGAVGPEAGTLTEELDRLLAAGEDQARLSLPTAVELVEDLRAFVADPPLGPLASEPIDKLIPVVVRRELKRVAKRADRCLHADPGPQREENLHALRKSSKRARYACELLSDKEPRLGPASKTLTQIQTVLGEYNDSHSAQTLLVELAERARRRGESTFLYGRLHAREEHQMESMLVSLPSLLTKLEHQLGHVVLH